MINRMSPQMNQAVLFSIPAASCVSEHHTPSLLEMDTEFKFIPMSNKMSFF